MPSFKPKANKKIVTNSRCSITLDSKHQEKMEEFHNIENKIIPSLRSDKKALLKKLENTEKQTLVLLYWHIQSVLLKLLQK